MKKWLSENKAGWLILAFIVGLYFMLSEEAKADTAIWVAPETQFIAGHKAPGTAMQFTESFGEGKYEISLLLNVGTEDVDNNAAFIVQRVVTYKRYSMGLGGALWQNETRAWNATKTFALDLRWRITDRWRVKWQHFSTGGSSRRNGGLDMIMVGYDFG